MYQYQKAYSIVANHRFFVHPLIFIIQPQLNITHNRQEKKRHFERENHRIYPAVPFEENKI
jgi:hypothetical protein